MDTDAESVSTVPTDKPNVTLDDVAKGPRAFLNEPIPESPRQPPENENKLNELGAVSDKPSVNPDKKIDAEQPEASLQPADTTQKSPVEETKPAPVAPEAPAAVNGKAKAEKPKQAAPTAPTKTAPVKKTAVRPSTISTKPTAPTKPPAKSPAALKTPTSATSKPETKATPKAHERLAVKKEASTTSKTGSTATKPTASSASKKPQPIKTSASDTGFVKPKPKSPTKPVHLPASLMAPTASSVSKGAAAQRQSLSRQSNNAQNAGTVKRSPSRASASTTTGAAGNKTVKRQTSNISRSRPSLGPPPKKTTQDQAPKKETHVDESFLARMMRPTQSSSSKTTEKAPVTPPRKTAKRPSTGAEHNLRREGSVKNLGGKKPAKQATASVASSEATAPAKAKAVPVETAAPKTPDAGEKTAEQATTEVNTSEEPEAPVEEPKQPEAIPEPSVEEVAVEAANVETAEEAIELAKEADLVEETPLVEEVAVETANVETAQEAIEVAEKVDLVEDDVTDNESVPEAKKDEPASLEQLKAEIASAQPEEVEFDEPEVAEEEVIDNETQKSEAVDEPQATDKAAEVEVEVAEPEPSNTEDELLAESLKGMSIEDEKEKKSDEAPEVSTGDIKKEAEVVVDEKPEDLKQESAPKEVAAAN